MKKTNQTPIAFYPQLVYLLGDIETALFYQQIWYWSDKGGRTDGFVYKTQKELEVETTLSRKQQDRVKKKLVEMGWLETKKKKANGSPVIHYKPLVDVTEAVAKCPKGTNGNVQKGQIREMSKRDKSITENTQRIQHCEQESSQANTPLNQQEYLNYLEKMQNDNKRHIRVIAVYLQKLHTLYGKQVFSTLAEKDEVIKRHCRAAKSVGRFGNEKILTAMDTAFSKVGEETTLETVYKYLTK